MSELERRQDDIDTAAAEWAARLGGDPLSEAERRALVRWIGRSPSHRAALEEARATWAKLGQLGLHPGALGLGLPPVAMARRRPSVSMRAAALAAGVLVAAWAGAAFWLGDPLTALAADHRSEPGEQKIVTLADGSMVHLGPASAIAVHYTEATRRVELLSGVAYFSAAPMMGGEFRPFVVEAGNGTARALGTQFMVDRLPEAVEVTVVEHAVEVALADGEGRRPRAVLNPGQSVRYAETGLGPVGDVRLALATAWQHGSLIFDRVPLGEVVAELNRYRRGRIVITDPALASRTVSGVFESHDPDAALATIIRVLEIQSASLPPLVTLLY